MQNRNNLDVLLDEKLVIRDKKRDGASKALQEAIRRTKDDIKQAFAEPEHSRSPRKERRKRRAQG